MGKKVILEIINVGKTKDLKNCVKTLKIQMLWIKHNYTEIKYQVGYN